jgi:chaperonin GroEL (HSP60 family)
MDNFFKDEIVFIHNSFQHNLLGIMEIYNVLKTTLGPNAMSKMLVDSFGGIVITSDGSKILEMMDIVHPAAKFMVEIAKTQDYEVGDGTTTTVLLSSQLYKNITIIMINKKMYNKQITRYMREAFEYLDEELENYVTKKEISKVFF